MCFFILKFHFFLSSSLNQFHGTLGDNSSTKNFRIKFISLSVLCRNSLGGGNVTARPLGVRSAQLAPSHVCDVTSVSRSCVLRQVRFQEILSGET